MLSTMKQHSKSKSSTSHNKKTKKNYPHGIVIVYQK